MGNTLDEEKTYPAVLIDGNLYLFSKDRTCPDALPYGLSVVDIISGNEIFFPDTHPKKTEDFCLGMLIGRGPFPTEWRFLDYGPQICFGEMSLEEYVQALGNGISGTWKDADGNMYLCGGRHTISGEYMAQIADLPVIYRLVKGVLEEYGALLQSTTARTEHAVLRLDFDVICSDIFPVGTLCSILSGIPRADDVGDFECIALSFDRERER